MTRRPYFPPALAWLAGILILASGCIDQSPTAIVLDPATVSGEQAQLPNGLRPMLAGSAAAATSATHRITPAGGAIDFGIGSITFPAGAVHQATLITASTDGVSMAVEFGPHLEFGDAQPTLCFNVAGLDLSGGFAVIHVKDDGSQAAISHDADASGVCVRPSSFSKFILAAE